MATASSGSLNISSRELKDFVVLAPYSCQTTYPTTEDRGIGKIKFKALDLGGDQIACRVWKDYHGLICIPFRLMLTIRRDLQSQKKVDALLSNESLANVPFLILGNTIDLPYAALEDELRYYIALIDQIRLDLIIFKYCIIL